MSSSESIQSASHMVELTLTGFCLKYDFRAFIASGAGAKEVAAQSKWPIVAQGEIELHLGVALFDRPFVFTPTRIITERQQIIEGEAVFDWLAEGCYRMPRSEVFGLDVRGKGAQVFARDIDAEESPIAIYGNTTWIVTLIEIDPTSGAEVQRLDRPELPDRFRRALKCYRSGLRVNLTQILS